MCVCKSKRAVCYSENFLINRDHRTVDNDNSDDVDFFSHVLLVMEDCEECFFVSSSLDYLAVSKFDSELRVLFSIFIILSILLL